MDMGDVPSKRELASARAERKIVYKKKPVLIPRPSAGFLSNKFEGNPGVWTQPTAKDNRRSYKA